MQQSYQSSARFRYYEPPQPRPVAPKGQPGQGSPGPMVQSVEPFSMPVPTAVMGNMASQQQHQQHVQQQQQQQQQQQSQQHQQLRRQLSQVAQMNQTVTANHLNAGPYPSQSAVQNHVQNHVQSVQNARTAPSFPNSPHMQSAQVFHNSPLQNSSMQSSSSVQSAQTNKTTHNPPNVQAAAKTETDETAKSDSSDEVSDDGQRRLPSTAVTEQDLDDAYVQFILYCNPSIPTSVDTAELKRGFRSPPRTDGKMFDTFALLGLIRRLDSQELETWSALVLELGVEPPDPAKEQSTQKIQQFAVRLKRWLHAYHIDAFFQYLLNKPNCYYLSVPSATEDISEAIRDGVKPGDDLALRALVPEFRPKRGRRKAADDIDPQRSKRAASANPEYPAQANLPQTYSGTHPQSAFPWAPEHGEDPWVAAQRAIAPSSVSANLLPQSAHPFAQAPSFWADPNTPSTPYPHSAITPSSLHDRPFTPTGSESTSQSAHPSSSSPPARRKRPGSTVSAAWTGGVNSATGKLRGRPPSDRTMQDGPFSRFPAKSGATSSPSLLNPTASPKPSPTPTAGNSPAFAPSPLNPTQHAPTFAPSPLNPTTQNAAPPNAQTTPGPKPSKLQLQVPQHEGGPVRLATPPAASLLPKVLVNGQDKAATGRIGGGGGERGDSGDFSSTVDGDFDGDEARDEDEDEDGLTLAYWRRRALALEKMLALKEEELRTVKRKVLEVVM